MNIYRIHIRPKGGSASMRRTFEYCRRNGVLGVGWRVDGLASTHDWKEYANAASKVHGDINVVRYIKRSIAADDLVWTRDIDSQYYLAKVRSGWHYWTTEEERQENIDIANVFDCQLKQVHIDEVPGKVVASFRAPRTIQYVAGEAAREYSKYLWNKLTERDDYEPEFSAFHGDLFEMLDDEEAEDVLFLYLQSRGWYVVPHSRKGDTMKFEYYAIDPTTGTRAITQAKTGRVPISPAEYSRPADGAFLFQARDLYRGDVPENVECISSATLRNFVLDNLHWLPGAVKKKAEMVGLSQG